MLYERSEDIPLSKREVKLRSRSTSRASQMDTVSKKSIMQRINDKVFDDDDTHSITALSNKSNPLLRGSDSANRMVKSRSDKSLVSNSTLGR